MFYTSLNSRGYKIKWKTTPYTAFWIDNDAYYWDIQSAATFFPGIKCPGVRDLNKCQTSAYPGRNSCQMPGGCPGDGHSWIYSYVTRSITSLTLCFDFELTPQPAMLSSVLLSPDDIRANISRVCACHLYYKNTFSSRSRKHFSGAVVTGTQTHVVSVKQSTSTTVPGLGFLFYVFIIYRRQVVSEFQSKVSDSYCF